MNKLLETFLNLFISKEKKFKKLVIDEINNKKFLNARKIPSTLSNKQRYQIINNLIQTKKIEGVLLSDKLYFFSIQKGNLDEIRINLKEKGKMDITPLLHTWKVKPKTITLLLKHLEKGYLSNKIYYTEKYLEMHVLSSLKEKAECDINSIAKAIGIDTQILISMALKLIEDGKLDGVIKDGKTFLNATNFEEKLIEYIEKLKDHVTEIEFRSISEELNVPSEVVERFLMRLVEKSIQDNITVYPLEGKLVFKK
ncbi:MAG: hypothetical protein ACTSSG_04410 [Candidatus Heimdallarchaeaceae archaeon]